MSDPAIIGQNKQTASQFFGARRALAIAIVLLPIAVATGWYAERWSAISQVPSPTVGDASGSSSPQYQQYDTTPEELLSQVVDAYTAEGADPNAKERKVTLSLTKEQAAALIYILGNSVQARSQGGTSVAGDDRDRPATSDGRLSTAAPLIFAFIGTISLIVLLMVYAGISLVSGGIASGGAKIDVFGMKIDAKGGGIAAIAFAAVVLLATYRPLIDAVVTLSRD
jgi:hypothetical protein